MVVSFYILYSMITLPFFIKFTQIGTNAPEVEVQFTDITTPFNREYIDEGRFRLVFENDVLDSAVIPDVYGIVRGYDQGYYFRAYKSHVHTITIETGVLGGGYTNDVLNETHIPIIIYPLL
jgi:hypothetical protein